MNVRLLRTCFASYSLRDGAVTLLFLFSVVFAIIPIGKRKFAPAGLISALPRVDNLGDFLFAEFFNKTYDL